MVILAYKEVKAIKELSVKLARKDWSVTLAYKAISVYREASAARARQVFKDLDCRVSRAG